MPRPGMTGHSGAQHHGRGCDRIEVGCGSPWGLGCGGVGFVSAQIRAPQVQALESRGLVPGATALSTTAEGAGGGLLGPLGARFLKVPQPWRPRVPQSRMLWWCGSRPDSLRTGQGHTRAVGSSPGPVALPPVGVGVVTKAHAAPEDVNARAAPEGHRSRSSSARGRPSSDARGAPGQWGSSRAREAEERHPKAAEEQHPSGVRGAAGERRLRSG